ncbi:MAG: tyrosine-type recombinase/integrase [Verrucomicrobia bacterium]|nr:tyrosine-type recombinase/integrase [Verrucomicrobiota bacterium]
MRAELPPGAESAREFWRVAVKSKPRQDWQLTQWAEGMRWYLKWFEICRKDVDLQVKMRKIKPRAAVILDINQVLAVIGKLEPRYQVMASLQYGAGLRLSELTRLRIKDVDLNRGVLTIRSGKGDRDRLTVIPNCLKPGLELQIARSRTLWEEDRANQVGTRIEIQAQPNLSPRAGFLTTKRDRQKGTGTLTMGCHRREMKRRGVRC